MIDPKAIASDQGKVYLVANGDQRLSANQVCWPAQEAMESQLTAAFEKLGLQVVRAHPYDPHKQHGFIDSQRMGMRVFERIPRDAPVVVALSVWQFSHHILAGLRDHRGPILTVANWSGQWPGLVGLLNLNGSLTKMGVTYSSLWSEDFSDDFFMNGLREWLLTGRIHHNLSHVHPLDPALLPKSDRELGENLARELLQRKAILGVFDEGCMGMYNAIVEDELMNACGIYKERLSQSALLAEMRRVADSEAEACLEWLLDRGVRFQWGSDGASELTRGQTLEQLRMYVAAVRMAHRFGCDAIGIQYQLGLMDMAPASDLAEGLLNNPDRPPVYDPQTGQELYAGEALPHFNEADEGAGIDALVTHRVWKALGLDPSTTLHDLRWGDTYDGQFVWVLMISGAAPASHFKGGYAGAVSERQPPMYFPAGGGTLKGVGKPGTIVWSRLYIEDGALHCDLGTGTVVDLPEEEVQRRWQLTTPQWPIVNAVFHGVTRDQMMAKHKANHVNVAYAPDERRARQALRVKAAMLATLGIKVNLCGTEERA